MSTESESDLDFSEFTPEPETGDLRQLAALVKQAGELQESFKRTEKVAKDLKERHRLLVEVEIPEFMLRHGGFRQLQLAGFSVELTTPTFAGIPSPSSIAKEHDSDERDALVKRRNRALEILEQKAPSLLKRSFEVEFDRDEQEQAEEFDRKLQDLGIGARLVKGATVHPKTLAKWVKELESEAVALTDEERKVFGVLTKNIAKITKH